MAALLWLPTLSAGLNIMSYTFAGFVPDHRCHLPCLEDDDIGLDDKEWFKQLDTDKLNTRCEFFQFQGSSLNTSEQCSSSMFSDNMTHQCQQYVYDRTIFSETLVTRFDLVCDQSWKKGFIGLDLFRFPPCFE